MQWLCRHYSAALLKGCTSTSIFPGCHVIHGRQWRRGEEPCMAWLLLSARSRPLHARCLGWMEDGGWMGGGGLISHATGLRPAPALLQLLHAGVPPSFRLPDPLFKQLHCWLVVWQAATILPLLFPFCTHHFVSQPSNILTFHGSSLMGVSTFPWGPLFPLPFTTFMFGWLHAVLFLSVTLMSERLLHSKQGQVGRADLLA